MIENFRLFEMLGSCEDGAIRISMTPDLVKWLNSHLFPSVPYIDHLKLYIGQDKGIYISNSERVWSSKKFFDGDVEIRPFIATRKDGIFFGVDVHITASSRFKDRFNTDIEGVHEELGKVIETLKEIEKILLSNPVIRNREKSSRLGI